MTPATLRDLADGVSLLEFPGAPDGEANRRAVAVANFLRGDPPCGLLEVIPGARTALLLFEPEELPSAELARHIARAAGDEARPAARLFRIPVHYGGAAGADLAQLAAERKIPPGEIVHRHSAAEYMVAFLGFAPGFAYLTGLPRELHSPRLLTPRTRVPSGSVGIGGQYTGIYPAESPGGWRLIGRAPIVLFDPARDPPSLLASGDRVRFEPIGREEFERRERALAPSTEPSDPPGAPLFRVARSGVWTSVQGAPRYGRAQAGMPPGGAMDLEALARGNRLLGNASAAGALEMTLVGPELEVLSSSVVCVAGAAVSPEVNGRPVQDASVFEVRAGDRLRVGPLRQGARGYLCVGGGLAESLRLEPARRLQGGDRIFAAGAPGEAHAAGAESPRTSAASRSGERVVRVVLDFPQEHFEEKGIATFLGTAYRVCSSSDRRGVRIDGERIAHRGSAEVSPEGTALGAIQVPGDGQPIILGPDRPVTGGYAKIGTVIAADFPLVAQAVSGALLRFRPVTLAEALEARSRIRRLWSWI